MLYVNYHIDLLLASSTKIDPISFVCAVMVSFTSFKLLGLGSLSFVALITLYMAMKCKDLSRVLFIAFVVRILFLIINNNFIATRYHSLVIDEDSLSKEFEVSARSEDGTIMAIQHNNLSVTGIQFHPESIATENGKTLLKNFLEGK